MPTGSKKLKAAAFFAEFTCTFAAIIMIYLIIDFSNLSYVVKNRFAPSRRSVFSVLTVIYAIGHIYRTIASSYSFRNAYLPDKSHKTFCHCVISLVLSVLWFAVMIDQIMNKRWLIIYKNIDVIFLVMSAVDIVLFSVMTYGADQNRKQVYLSDRIDPFSGTSGNSLPPIDPYAFGSQQPYDNNHDMRPRS